jgi:hypothetical protein
MVLRKERTTKEEGYWRQSCRARTTDRDCVFIFAVLFYKNGAEKSNGYFSLIAPLR